MAQPVPVPEFARRVERLCEFLLDRFYEEEGRNGSTDQRALEDLKEEATDLADGATQIGVTLEGLGNALGAHDR